MPEKVLLTLVRPPIFLELDDDALYDKLMTAVRERELEIHRDMRLLSWFSGNQTGDEVS